MIARKMRTDVLVKNKRGGDAGPSLKTATIIEAFCLSRTVPIVFLLSRQLET